MPKYFNTTFGPIVWNDNGQIVGGGEWLTVEEPTQQIEDNLEKNHMVLVQEPVVEQKPARTRRSKKQEDTQE